LRLSLPSSDIMVNTMPSTSRVPCMRVNPARTCSRQRRRQHPVGGVRHRPPRCCCNCGGAASTRMHSADHLCGHVCQLSDALLAPSSLLRARQVSTAAAHPTAAACRRENQGHSHGHDAATHRLTPRTQSHAPASHVEHVGQRLCLERWQEGADEDGASTAAPKGSGCACCV
jgi:hypothetical protein